MPVQTTRELLSRTICNAACVLVAAWCGGLDGEATAGAGALSRGRIRRAAVIGGGYLHRLRLRFRSRDFRFGGRRRGGNRLIAGDGRSSLRFRRRCNAGGRLRRGALWEGVIRPLSTRRRTSGGTGCNGGIGRSRRSIR